DDHGAADEVARVAHRSVVHLLEVEHQLIGLEFLASGLLHGIGRLDGGSERLRLNGFTMTWIVTGRRNPPPSMVTVHSSLRLSKRLVMRPLTSWALTRAQPITGICSL